MERQYLNEGQELLGHSSVITALSIYTHLIPGRGGDDIIPEANS